MTGLVSAAVLTVAVLYGPGFLALRAARAPVLVALGFAPALGVVLAVVTGGLLHMLGVPTGTWVAPVLLVGCAVAGIGVGRLSRRALGSDLGLHAVPTRPALLAAGVGFALFAVGLLVAIGRPDAWPQMPDTIFHVGAAVWMTRHGSAWLGDVTVYATGAPSFAYPGAWHVLVSLVSTWSGADPLVASHAVVLVVGGMVWPVSLSLLAWRTVGPSRAVVLAAPLVSLAFVGVPSRLLEWGVLWPYLLSAAFLPLVLLGLRALTAPGRAAPERVSAGLLTLAALAAATLAHTSAPFLALLVGAPLVIGWTWSRCGVLPRTAMVLATLTAVLTLWSFAPSAMVLLYVDRPAASPVEALVGLFQSLSSSFLPAVLLLGIVLAGLGVTARAPGLRWVAAGTVATLAAVLLSPLLPGPVRALTLWPWFSDANRLQAPLAVFAALSSLAVVQRLASTAGRRRVPAAAALLAGAALVVTALASNVSLVRDRYQPPSGTPTWATSGEIDALRALGQRVPEGAVVAADPLSGGTQLYRFRDVRLLLPTDKSVLTDPGLLALARGLDRIGLDAEVCGLARAHAVEYVVTGGTPVTWDIPVSDFAGVRDVSAEDGFTSLATVAPYTLWRVPACSA